MFELPRHPESGIEAIAVLPSGRVVWPIRGGDGTEDADPDKGGDSKAKAKTGAADPDKGDGADSEVEKWKALARQHENLWKSTGLTKDELPEAKEILRQAKADKDKNATADSRIAALEAKIAESEARAVRLEIAGAKGLTPAQAKRLQGTTREELESDADEFLKELKPGKGEADEGDDAGDGKPANGADDKSRRPTEKLRPGAVPQAEPEETDPAKLAAKVPRLYS